MTASVLSFAHQIESMTRGLDHQQLTRISDALVFAMRAHASTERKKGEPYVTHPFRVALRAHLHGMDTDSVIAALLHDVVEDTDTSSDQMTLLFGERVASLVVTLTKPSDGTPNRDLIYRQQLLSGPDEAKQIKLFDIEDNLADVDSFLLPEDALEYRMKREQLASDLRLSLDRRNKK